jgi:hypothetical protein
VSVCLNPPARVALSATFTDTNAAAIAAIEFAIEASSALNITLDPLWQKTADALTIPFDAANGIHPEFVGMPMKGFEGKQADTAMLYFPLEYNLRHNISETVAQADLEFYAAHTAPSPDMTHAIQVQQQQQQPHSRAPMRLLAILTVLGCLACLPTGVYVMLPLWVGLRIQKKISQLGACAC